MNGKKIVVVDDDPGILRLISSNLEARGYEAPAFSSGTPALEYLGEQRPDLVILDILLPGVDGMELVRRIRGSSGVPIMMVSGKEEVNTKLEALDLGADDYLTKPFSVEELLARVRAILRRCDTINPMDAMSIYQCEDLEVDLDRSEVTRSGEEVKLSAREWAVLRTFVKYVGKVVSHRMLLQQAWGPEYGDEGDYVRTYVTRLRKKLEPEPQNPRYIVTERGMGYRLVSPSAGRYPVQPAGATGRTTRKEPLRAL